MKKTLTFILSALLLRITVPFCGKRPQSRGFQPRYIHEIRGWNTIRRSDFIFRC